MGQEKIMVCKKCGTVGGAMCGTGMCRDLDDEETRILYCPGCRTVETVTLLCREWMSFKPRCRNCGTYMRDAEYHPYDLKCPYCGERTLDLKTGLMFD